MTSPKHPLDKLYRRPGFMIRRAHQIAVSLFLEETGALGITNRQYGIMLVLKEEPGIDQITVANDPTTNYQILPGDRLVVRRRELAPNGSDGAAMRLPTSNRRQAGGGFIPDRPEHSIAPNANAAPQKSIGAESPAFQRLEKRMGEMEQKLDLILEAIKRPAG